MTAIHTVLVTRPEPGASETASYLAARGLRAVIVPFLEVIPLAATLPNQVIACVITSSNALWAIPPGVPIFAVGDATAKRASRMTDAHVTSAGADAKALACLIKQNLKPVQGTLLLLSGLGQGLPLADELRASGFKVIRRAVYRSKRMRKFPSKALIAIEQSQVISALFFSSETAISFTKLCPASLYPLIQRAKAFALSPSIAKILASMPWLSIEVAEHPSQEALLKLVVCMA